MNEHNKIMHIDNGGEIRKKTENEIAEALRQGKRDAIKAAKELGYMPMFPNLEREIKEAKTLRKVTQLMSVCRHSL